MQIQDILSFTSQEILDFLNEPIIKMGDSTITLLSILIVLFGIIGIIIFSGLFKKFLIHKVLKNRIQDSGLRNSIGVMSKWTITAIGIFIILESVGIKLGTLGVLFGALGIGIGFGLQSIADNFISGIIILIERPIKVGDRIEVGNVKGDVIEIAARSTTILTNDNITLIVPNSEFISKTVINWSHGDEKVRFRFPVGVSYNEDPEKVKNILDQVISENEGVLKYPKPEVVFDNFGDSSLDFLLYVWTSEYTQRSTKLKSQLYYEIFKKFEEHSIEIPFPQRDIHIKSDLDSPIFIKRD